VARETGARMSAERERDAAAWARHHAEWRDTAQVASQWREASSIDPRLLRGRASGGWWDLLESTGITLIITREYEHLVVAMSATGGQPALSFFPMPHPSGLAIDRTRGSVHIASTRNPNQLFELVPAVGVVPRLDATADRDPDRPLVPVRSRLFPGCLYLHDLAFVDGELLGNAVGENAVVRFEADGAHTRVWWPRCIDTPKGPMFARNHLQLNSIAAGATLDASYFSASTDVIANRRPGHRNFPVDGRGVIFSGATREPIARGLTRPHSARLHKGRVWVANSGYGQLGAVSDGRFEPVASLRGWTRGLSFYRHVAFVATSRVIPRFRAYAPGLDVDRSVCGVHAIDTRNGALLGSFVFPGGNQIFAVDWLPARISRGFPFKAGRRRAKQETRLFYAFRVR
jgi:uncharacterized protein (TIGR03032 family)